MWDLGKTAAKTYTQKLQEKERFEREFGPDRAPMVHQFPDGWSIRHLKTPHSECYEGELQPNCLGGSSTLRDQIPEELWHDDPDPIPMMSLRDPANLPHATFVDPYYWAENYPDIHPSGKVGFGDLDLEGGHGSNPGKYAPYVHDWFVNQYGGQPVAPKDWDYEYGVPQTPGADGHRAEPDHTFQDFRPAGFWHPGYESRIEDLPHLKRAVKPLRKAWDRLMNGDDFSTVADDVGGRLRNNYRDEQVSYMVGDLKRDHDKWKEYQPYTEQQMQPPGRMEFPEFYWMHGAYGPEVMQKVKEAQAGYRALHWNHPQAFASNLQRELDGLGLDPAQSDKIAGHWLDAHGQAMAHRTGTPWEGPQKIMRPEDYAHEHAQRMVDSFGSVSELSPEELYQTAYDTHLKRNSTTSWDYEPSVDDLAATAAPWSHGENGKGLLNADGELTTWSTDEYGEPHHDDVAQQRDFPYVAKVDIYPSGICIIGSPDEENLFGADRETAEAMLREAAPQHGLRFTERFSHVGRHEALVAVVEEPVAVPTETLGLATEWLDVTSQPQLTADGTLGMLSIGDVERDHQPHSLPRVAGIMQYAEHMDPSHLLPYREYEWDRFNNRDGTQKWDELRDQIKQNGFEDPVTLDFNPDTGEAYVSEGNHRLGIAHELGIPLPVMVMRSTKTRINGYPMHPLRLPGAYRMEDERGYSRFPQYARPSQIDLPTVPTPT